jgi:Ca-activated chloride channel family protein
MRKSCRTLTLMPILLILCLLTGASRPLAAKSRPEVAGGKDQTLSPYFVVLSGDPEKDALPLKSTRADVKIAGVVAAVKITQVYKNQGKKALEAIYVFPASSRAAVHAMRLTVGQRIIEAQIMERSQARETYEAAKKAGQTTSLLEQQRPNVFQMNVANILPGDEVKVELNYMELLEPEDNVYEFVLPTVVGPRYSNLAARGAPATEQWVQNPYLHQGQAPPYTYGLSLEVLSALPIVQLASPSHEVEVKYSGKTAAQVKVKDETMAGNKDFVLHYALAGKKIETGLLLYPGQDENFFLLMMEPPARVKQDAVVPREYIFIVDVSGSMHGFPLEVSKALMKDIIAGLRPQDFINVLLFESGAAVLSETGSLPANEANKQQALAFINARPGGGGTEILKALQRALALPRTPKASRIVVVATDGYVHVEPQAFELIRQHLGEANLFPFGIGTAVNRHLIEGMARAGLGEPFVVLNQAEAAKQAARFRRYIDSPVLTQIKVNFEGFDAYEVEPPALPDLFAQRPLTMLGKYRGSPSGAIVVKGRTAAGAYERRIEVAPAPAGAANSALRLLWARHRIRRLADLNRLKPADARVKEVTALGLKHSLMTAYTSFVAVDKVKRADGRVVTVKQPLPLPEGVSDLAVGAGGAMMRKAMAGPGIGASYQTALEAAPAPPATKLPPPGQKTDATAVPGAKVKIKIQVARIQGNLEKAAVQQALEAKEPQLARCLEAALKRAAKLPPEIILNFTIGPDGQVTGEKVVETTLDQSLEKCLSQAVRAIQFPGPGPQAAQVTVKLVLAVN